MIDHDLKNELEKINANVAALQLKWWKSLLHGLMTGFGSVLGVVLALAVLGWLLNIAGVIPAFRKEAGEWRKLIEQAQQRLPAKSQIEK